MEELLNYLKAFDGGGLRYYVSKFCYTHEGYEYHCGATRICIYHKDWDFVLKFDELYKTTAYCAIEFYHYEMAKKYNVQKILLPIEKIAVFDNGLKIYRQVKFTANWDDLSRKDHKSLKQAYDQSRNSKAFRKIRDSMYYEIHNYWIARTTQLYGKKFMCSLEQWLIDYEINDLHIGNIAMLNGRPVLLDYAGYRGTGYCPPKEILENY